MGHARSELEQISFLFNTLYSNLDRFLPVYSFLISSTSVNGAFEGFYDRGSPLRTSITTPYGAVTRYRLKRSNET